MFRFTIRDVLWLTVVVAGAAWRSMPANMLQHLKLMMATVRPGAW